MVGLWGAGAGRRCLRDRVISYLGETSWSAGRSAGPRGCPGRDASEEKPLRKSPEPVSFIKSDKLFLTIAPFLLFYNAVIWTSAPLPLSLSLYDGRGDKKKKPATDGRTGDQRRRPRFVLKTRTLAALPQHVRR